MGTLEDIMKTLERIPLWKRLTALPAEVQELRARVEALEAQLAGKPGTLCPICNATGFKRVSSKPHPEFGFAGIKLDSYRCDACGHAEDRERNEGHHSR
jgi:ribosomal protein L37AE/L43A